MTARATSKTFGQFSSFEAIKSILSLNAKDPDNAPLAGDSATFVDANGNPKTAVYGPTGWYIEGVGKESPDSTSIQFDRAVVPPNLAYQRTKPEILGDSKAYLLTGIGGTPQGFNLGWSRDLQNAYGLNNGGIAFQIQIASAAWGTRVDARDPNVQHWFGRYIAAFTDMHNSLPRADKRHSAWP